MSKDEILELGIREEIKKDLIKLMKLKDKEGRTIRTVTMVELLDSDLKDLHINGLITTPQFNDLRNDLLTF